MEKYTYENYEDYNRAAIEFAKDKSIQTIKTLCDRENKLFEIKVEKKDRL